MFPVGFSREKINLVIANLTEGPILASLIVLILCFIPAYLFTSLLLAPPSYPETAHPSQNGCFNSPDGLRSEFALNLTRSMFLELVDGKKPLVTARHLGFDYCILCVVAQDRNILVQQNSVLCLLDPQVVYISAKQATVLQTIPLLKLNDVHVRRTTEIVLLSGDSTHHLVGSAAQYAETALHILGNRLVVDKFAREFPSTPQSPV